MDSWKYKQYAYPVFDEFDTLVVGAGVVGLAVALTLAKRGHAVMVTEESPPHGKGAVDGAQSLRSSGVIHSPVSYIPGSKKAILCGAGMQPLYDFARVHNVPHVKTGEVIVGNTDAEFQQIQDLWANAKRNGVEDAVVVVGSDVKRLVPNVRAKVALHVPGTGIIDAAAYLEALRRECELAGVRIEHYAKAIGVPEIRTETVTVRLAQRAPEIETPLFDVRVHHLVNAAGLGSAQFAQIVNPSNTWELNKVRGEYVSFDAFSRANLRVHKMPMYSPPRKYSGIDGLTHTTLGVHTTPTIDGTRGPDGKWHTSGKVLVGPTMKPVRHVTDDRFTHQLEIEEIIEPMRKLIALNKEDCTPEYVGIQARGAWSGQDFEIQREKLYPRCIHLVGIDSPGLTASLAIANEVGEMLKKTP